jgi:hypothetical protein
VSFALCTLELVTSLEIYVKQSRVASGPIDFARATENLPPWVELVEVDHDTSRCVAALWFYDAQPRFGLARFLAGRRRMEEEALVLCGLNPGDAMRLLEGLDVQARNLPPGTRARLGSDLERPDKDLAIRLTGPKSAETAWLAINPNQPHPDFHELVVDDVGEALTGVWIQKDPPERWYFFPYSADWQVILKWLVDVAVPGYVPKAIVRSRPQEVVEEGVLTPDELSLTRDIERVERESRHQLDDLNARLIRSRERANRLRVPLLFGTDDELKNAVAEILSNCGFTVEDLDKTFQGEEKSADLLLEFDDRYWLVEVTATAGVPRNREWEHLKGHESTWAYRRPDRSLSGRVLIINNSHREPPSARPSPYPQRDFKKVLDGVVIGTTALWSWHKDGNHEATRDAIMGVPGVYPP